MYRVFSGRVILYLLFLLVLDITLVPLVRIGFVRPVLEYLIILYAAFQWGWQKTLPIAITVGILRDFVSSQSLGIETSSLIFASFVLDLLVQKMEREIWFLRLTAAFLFVFCASMSSLILSSFLGEGIHVSGASVTIALGTSFYTAILMPPFFYLTARWFHDRFAFKQYELFR